MTKRQIMLAVGSIVIFAGIGYAFYRLKEEKDREIVNLEEGIAYLHEKLNRIDKENTRLERQLQETESAINTFCEQNTIESIKELVKIRLTIYEMRENGASEEDITKKLVHSDGPNVIKMKHIANDLRYSTPPEEEEDEPVEDDPDAGYEEIKPDPNLPNVHLINEVDFVNDDDYDKTCITYFGGDDTLCDIDDDILDQDTMEMTELLTEFTNTDRPSIFIRNEKMALDYEILWDDSSYQETILGMTGKTATLLPRIFRRRSEDEPADTDY